MPLCKNISIDIIRKGRFMTIDYSDDGKGFDFLAVSNSPAGGSGLKNIVNRVNAMKGKIEIESEIDRGMKARLKIPV